MGYGLRAKDFFQPQREEELSYLSPEQVAGWFAAVGIRTGEQTVDRIVLQFSRRSDGRLEAFRPLPPGEENTSDSYGRLVLSRAGGKYWVDAASGTGAQQVLWQLRAREFLSIPDDLRGRLIGKYFQPKREEELARLTLEQIDGWFAAVAASKEKAVERILLQFIRKSNGQLSGFRPVVSGEENTSDSYGRLTLGRSGLTYSIEAANGTGASRILDILRNTPLAQGDNPALRITVRE